MDQSLPGVIHSVASANEVQNTQGEAGITNGNGILKEDLLAAFEAIKLSKCAAAYQPLDEPLPMSLTVLGVGSISVPLRAKQAEDLIDKARQMSCSQGTDPLAQPAAHSTWELGAEQLVFRDTAWPAFLSKLSRTVSRLLGTNGKVKAHLEKLVIYGKGATVKKHADVQKIPGMFGTLIIYLPSVHLGGNVKLQYGGETKVHAPCEAGQSITCWYSGVSHEVLPITSGYRWALKFNLSLASSTVPSSPAAWVHDPVELLRNTLRQWLAEDKQSRRFGYIYYLLDHEYNRHGFNFESLGEGDLSQVLALRNATTGLPVDVLLAELDRVESGPCRPAASDDEETTDYEEDWQNPAYLLTKATSVSHAVRRLIELDGRPVMDWLSLEENEILNAADFTLYSPGDENYSEEREGEDWQPHTSRCYTRSAFVIVPRDTLGLYLQRRHEGDAIDHFLSWYENFVLPYPESSEPRIAALEAFCKQLWDGTCGAPGEGNSALDHIEEHLSDIMEFWLLHKRYDMFEKVAANHRGRLSDDFFQWLHDWFIRQSDPRASFREIRKGLTLAIQAYPSYWSRAQAVWIFALPEIPLPPNETWLSPEVRSWAQEIVNTSLPVDIHHQPHGRMTSSYLISMARYFDDPCDRIFEWASPYLSDIGFCIELLLQLWDDDAVYILPPMEKTHLTKTLAVSFIKGLDFSKMQTCNDYYAESEEESLSSLSAAEQQTPIRSYLLSRFFEEVVNLSSEQPELLALLLSRCCECAPEFTAEHLEGFWMPLLAYLPPVLAENSIPLDHPPFRNMGRAIITQFLINYMGPEPFIDVKLARAAVKCRCEHCKPLNRFLGNCEKKLTTFDVPSSMVAHMTKGLANIDCMYKVSPCLGKAERRKLVVMKTFVQDEMDHQTWTERKSIAIERLFDIGLRHLELILGDQYEVFFDTEEFALDIRNEPLSVVPSQTMSSSQGVESLSGRSNRKRRRLSSDGSVL